MVAYYGVAEGLEVDSDLMGAAGFDFDLYESEGTVGGGDALKDADVGDGAATVGAAGGHAGATDEVTGYGEGYGGRVLGEVGAWANAM